MNKEQDIENTDKALNIGGVSISASSIDCPECKKEGCGFCNGTGLIWFYPPADAYDYIEISRAKWRISQRH